MSSGVSSKLAMFEQAAKAKEQTSSPIPKQPPYKAPNPPATALKPPSTAPKPGFSGMKPVAVMPTAGKPPPLKAKKPELEPKPAVSDESTGRKRPPGAKALAPVGINTLAQIKGGLRSPTRVNSEFFKDPAEQNGVEDSSDKTDTENAPQRPPGRPPKTESSPSQKLPTRRVVEPPKPPSDEMKPVMYEGKVLPKTIQLASGVVLKLQPFVPPTEPAPPPPPRPPHVRLGAGR